MKTFIFLCCTTVLGFSTTKLFSQDAKVTIEADKTLSIFEIFELIGKQTDCTFIYQSDIFRDVPNIQLKSGVIKVMKLLSQCLPSKNFLINSNKENLITISLKPSNELQQKSIQVKGVIKNSNGIPIAGATIIIKGTNRGTTSDFDGNYDIYANSDDVLVIPFLGYKSIEQSINGQITINIVLQQDTENLKEVVINAGYYTTTDREKTGSISRITDKIIETQPVNTALDALQGRVTGLDIIPTTGLPGGGYTVRIRGQNSIGAGNNPLYIVDGVPFASQSLSNSSISLAILPQGDVNPLNTLDPASIASIEVLKDADATAIYGSRGANGVILISTKKGRNGKTVVTVDVSTTTITPTKMLDLLNTEQYLSMRREALLNDGFTEYPPEAYDVNGTWNPTRFTDWQKELIGNTAYNHTVRANISGGNAQTVFNLGGSFIKETTVFPMQFNYKRSTVFTTLGHHSENGKFNVLFSANYGQDQNSLPANDLSRIARLLPPNAPALYDGEGNLNWEENTWDNPLAALKGTYLNNSHTLIANTVIGYTLLKGVILKTNLGYNRSDLDELQLNPHTIYNPAYGLTSSSSYALNNKNTRDSYVLEPQLDGSFQLGNGELKITLGATLQEQNSEAIALQGSGYENNSLLGHFSAAQNLEVLTENSSRYRYMAYYGRFNYNWKKHFILNITGRRDGSSRFGPGKQYTNFGAIGAAWVFSEATFMKPLTWLSYGKIRTSYGTTGNDQIGDYQFLDTYELTNVDYNGYIGLSPSRLLNPYFAWERNRKKEAALELGLWQNTLRMEVAYYQNRSDNQLLGIPLPGTTGFASINGNLDATVENSGWEFSVQSDLFRNDHFNWNASIQLTIPKNRLVAFEGLESSTYANQLVIGESLSVYKLYQLEGVNPDTGLFEFRDYNGDGTISSIEDRNYHVDLSPKLYGSIANSMHYKNWNLDILFQFVKKQGLNAFYATEPPGIMQNQPVGVLDHWKQTGDQAKMQAYTTGWNYDAYVAYSQFTTSSGIVSDASFIRLKTLSLSYRLPLKKEQPIRCSLFLQGQNLLTFTNFSGGDPEQLTGFLPPVRRISVGLKLEL
ncbi:SusC/RagA family TonB-linked outer membrane protein [Gelidibacter algens]|nr:SusC/RagA family TonB-linked outer membrane protein [Gelidibacter algens]